MKRCSTVTSGGHWGLQPRMMKHISDINKITLPTVSRSPPQGQFASAVPAVWQGGEPGKITKVGLGNFY